MLCTLHTYKHVHITVLKCAENYKVPKSVTRYTGSINKTRFYIHIASLSNFEIVFAFLILEIQTGLRKT